MDADEVRGLLARVAAGDIAPDEATATLAAAGVAGQGFVDLGFARVDTHRGLRTGDPEVVYAAGKTPAQTVAIVEVLRAASVDRPVLITRVPLETAAALRSAHPDADSDEVARCVTIGAAPAPRGTVVVLTAGTSDLPVAAEAVVTLAAYGAGARQINDVGVAGIHRLLAAREELVRADCVVVVAGMDGALPSAVGGLIGVPVVAVPTSVGYGASFGGLAALLAMLTSCAPGVTVVNIDNGFGAGVAAARIARARAGNDGRERAPHPGPLGADELAGRHQRAPHPGPLGADAR